MWHGKSLGVKGRGYGTMTKKELLIRLDRLEDNITGKCYVGENTTLLHMKNRMEEIRQEIINIIQETHKEDYEEECTLFYPIDNNTDECFSNCWGDGWYKCKECTWFERKNLDDYRRVR